MARSINCAWRRYSYCYLLLIVVSMVVLGSQHCDSFGTFGFDVHHRYSDPVKEVLDLHGLPEKGSVDYYAAMAHRDRLVWERKLAGTSAASSPPLTFAYGNETHRISGLGFLHYANVSVGSPGSWFLVALDTGSDLFWLPCDCKSCVLALNTSTGRVIDLNIYSPNKSSTSKNVPCSSNLCEKPRQCSLKYNSCAYEVQYLSANTSSSGLLVEDVLHLITDDTQPSVVDARVPLGCGIIQTGSFLDGAAPNGLFGLGMDNVSVPSVLAKEGLAANSFSMCFPSKGVGRINFGDKGSSRQSETSFNLKQSHPTYNVSVTQISVGNNVTDLSIGAIFDSGTSFTYLNEPAYSAIAESFNSLVKEKRHQSDDQIPFEYCYDLSANQESFDIPPINLTMKGGKQFYVFDPIILIKLINIQGEGYLYCLAVVKSEDINIIGQNFMTGYRIVFDRERMVLGWESSDCYNDNHSNTLPIDRGNNSVVPPTSSVQPEATSNGSPIPNPVSPPPPASDAPSLNSFSFATFLVIFSFFINFYAIPSL